MQERRIDRLDKFAQMKNLNDNRITKECNLSIGTLGKSRKPGKDISVKTAAKVLDCYTDLNRKWFLTGEGNMFNAGASAGYAAYPLIDSSKAECGKASGLAEAAMIEDLPRIALPGIPHETEFFIQASGYSMINKQNPDLSIPPAAFVGLAKINSGIIRWGEVYAIVTNDGIMLKRLFPDDSNNSSVKCVSYNTEDFPPFSIPFDDIREVARITCVVPVIIR